jgi:aspartyl-tRNA(Asn)/glutamyl-tRNA(Gln) amidotransferase subunit A
MAINQKVRHCQCIITLCSLAVLFTAFGVFMTDEVPNDMHSTPPEPAGSSATRAVPLHQPDITTLRQQLWNGEVTCQQLLEQTQLALAKHVDLNTLAYTDFVAAHERCIAADQTWQQLRKTSTLEQVPALLGLPISIKDLFKVRGMPMRAGTRAALPNISADEATLVTRLRAAGAVIFGKANMHEIALGATGENLWTGDVKNPFNPARQAGGSSSGSAVCVATGIGVASVGSDTGGSVRVPAAFNGIVGFKPSFGSIPLNGGLYLSPSFDHAGPLTRNVADARLLYGIMSGRNPRTFEISRPPKLGLLKTWQDNRLSAPMAARFDLACRQLRERGASFVVIDLPEITRCWEFYTPIARAEAALVHRDALRSHADGFSQLVKPPLEFGLDVKAVDYLAAQGLRAQVRVAVDNALRQCDAFALPTSAVATPLRGQTKIRAAHGFEFEVRDAVLGQTLAFSALGLPSISIPMGDVQPDEGGPAMPAGLQLVGSTQRDDLLLSLASWVETSLAQS